MFFIVYVCVIRMIRIGIENYWNDGGNGNDSMIYFRFKEERLKRNE